ncbi:MAG: DNA adenine methylase [Promethearchaeota archaeon]
MKSHAKPFLKWAGSKKQLVKEIINRVPYKKEEKFTFIEPFLGSGAVLFEMIKNFPNMNQVIINDINSELISTYIEIRDNVHEVIRKLQEKADTYFSFSTEDEKKEYYYQQRKLFNKRNTSKADHAALFIFLNKTCFNGLYRVNKKNEFNVPMGKYKNPLICDDENLKLVSDVLKKVIFLNGDFEKTKEYISRPTFVYLDPPYKPITKTSSFTSYSENSFSDDDQLRLQKFCKTISQKGGFWLLSNSDARDIYGNSFFEELYKGFKIERVNVKRFINASAEKRGEVKEVLVNNYG